MPDTNGCRFAKSLARTGHMYSAMQSTMMRASTSVGAQSSRCGEPRWCAVYRNMQFQPIAAAGIPKPGAYRIIVQIKRAGHVETGVFDAGS
jgi:hypothetical protein